MADTLSLEGDLDSIHVCFKNCIQEPVTDLVRATKMIAILILNFKASL